MNIKWDVNDTTVVDLKIGGFSKTVLTVNGKDIPTTLSANKKGEFAFDLDGGRHAAIAVQPRFASIPLIQLKVDGQSMMPTDKTTTKCPHCSATVKPNDKFCPACGKALPSPEDYALQKSVTEATTTIWVLSGLFALSAVVMFFVTQSENAEALSRLDGMNPGDPYPTPIDGVTYTVQQLRDQIAWAPWSALIVNLILAVIMAGLAVWGKRAPLAAVLIAAAIYIVVVVVSAIVDPETIGQGAFIKVMVIIFLVRGVKSALALRTAHAAHV